MPMAKCPRIPCVKLKIGQNHEICQIYKKHMENNKIQQYNVTRGLIGPRVLRMKTDNKDGKNNENVSTETVQSHEELLKRAVD